MTAWKAPKSGTYHLHPGRPPHPFEACTAKCADDRIGTREWLAEGFELADPTDSTWPPLEPKGSTDDED